MEKNIREIEIDKNIAIEEQDYENAAKLRDEERIKKEELERKKTDWREKEANEVVTVSEDDVSFVTSFITGIPLFRLERSESDRLLKMDKELSEKIVDWIK